MPGGLAGTLACGSASGYPFRPPSTPQASSAAQAEEVAVGCEARIQSTNLVIGLVIVPHASTP